MANTPNRNYPIPDPKKAVHPELRDTLMAIDADVDSIVAGGGSGLADPGSNGIVVRTALNTTVARSLTAPAAGLTISNNDGVSGNPTFALANDLAALEALASTGFSVRTGTDTWAQRTITGTAQQIAVANGNGVSGNPTLSIPADAQLSIETLEATIEITTPQVQADDVFTKTLVFNGATSGQVTIQPAAIAGTWTLTLPDTNGDADQALVTNGAGVTRWETVLTGNQTITLTGEVTGSGTTTIPTTITAQNSAFWRGKVTDETGTGVWVFNDSPTLITPVLGAATGTSLVLTGTLTADNVIADAEVASAAFVVNGLTSGDITIQSQTGTWTLTLPSDDGTSGQVLTTDGNGVTSWTSATAGANTALSNLASVAINTSLLLGASDGGALGSTTKMWSDLFLASGAVINFNNGDVTITHSANLLTVAGGNLDVPSLIAGSAQIGSIVVTTTFDPLTNNDIALGNTSEQWSDLFLGTGAVINFNNGNATLTHSAGLLTSNVDIVVPAEVYGAGWNGSNEVPTKNDVYDKIESIIAGSGGANTALSNLAAVAINASLLPGTSDAVALGSTTKQWSDLFLAEGGVINWDNGDATLTQSGDVLTLGGADFHISMPTTTVASVQSTGTVGSTRSILQLLNPASSGNGFDFGYNLDLSGEAFTIRSISNGTTLTAFTLAKATGALRLNTYGAGTLTTDASGNVTATSDERLKHVLSPFKRGLESLRSVQPILYKWREDSGLDPDSEYAGFSAQNLQECLPEAIFANSDGVLSLSDRPLLATLFNAVNELDKELRQLRSILANQTMLESGA